MMLVQRRPAAQQLPLPPLAFTRKKPLFFELDMTASVPALSALHLSHPAELISDSLKSRSHSQIGTLKGFRVIFFVTKAALQSVKLNVLHINPAF